MCVRYSAFFASLMLVTVPANANNDYPLLAMQEGREGVATFSATYDSFGAVTGCEITISSGHLDLDQATCDLVKLRARFKPGKDENGNAVGGVHVNKVRWELPKDGSKSEGDDADVAAKPKR